LLFIAAKDCVFLRVIFSFFRTSKNRQFTYRPLYYQAEADEQALRHSKSNPRRTRPANRNEHTEARDSNTGSDPQDERQEAYRPSLRLRRQMAQQEAQQSNRRLLFIIFILLSLLLLLFGELKKLMYLLPIFVPLLWWTFRRTARKGVATSSESSVTDRQSALGEPSISSPESAEPHQPA